MHSHICYMFFVYLIRDSLYRRFSPDVYLFYHLCQFLVWRMVSEESYESRFPLKKMRTAEFLFVFRGQVRDPQFRSTEFVVSYDP